VARRSAAGDGGIAVDPITLVGLVLEAAAGLRREIGSSLERDYGLPAQTFGVLIRLARSPGQRLRMSDLSSQTALTPSGLTRAVDRICEAGLATRESCPSDRRGAFAVLTPDGRSVMEAALSCHSDRLRQLFAGLFDDGEWRALLDLLARLRDRVSPDAAKVTA
jgi:MarR family 2-MHQ and catechol resistance regulon transcriptional repressor